jgi:hypothetical protein
VTWRSPYLSSESARGNTAKLMRRILIATSHLGFESWARYTSPIPPLLSKAVILVRAQLRADGQGHDFARGLQNSRCQWARKPLALSETREYPPLSNRQL